MSDETTYDPRTGGFDPERFFAMARNYGHGRALGLEYRQSAENWIELALPWREELVGGWASVRNGEFVLSDRPGLGLELDEAALARHPYRAGRAVICLAR